MKKTNKEKLKEIKIHYSTIYPQSWAFEGTILFGKKFIYLIEKLDCYGVLLAFKEGEEDKRLIIKNTDFNKYRLVPKENDINWKLYLKNKTSNDSKKTDKDKYLFIKSPLPKLMKSLQAFSKCFDIDKAFLKTVCLCDDKLHFVNFLIENKQQHFFYEKNYAKKIADLESDKITENIPENLSKNIYLKVKEAKKPPLKVIKRNVDFVKFNVIKGSIICLKKKLLINSKNTLKRPAIFLWRVQCGVEINQKIRML